MSLVFKLNVARKYINVFMYNLFKSNENIFAPDKEKVKYSNGKFLTYLYHDF